MYCTCIQILWKPFFMVSTLKTSPVIHPLPWNFKINLHCFILSFSCTIMDNSGANRHAVFFAYAANWALGILHKLYSEPIDVLFALLILQTQLYRNSVAYAQVFVRQRDSNLRLCRFVWQKATNLFAKSICDSVRLLNLAWSNDSYWHICTTARYHSFFRVLVKSCVQRF